MADTNNHGYRCPECGEPSRAELQKRIDELESERTALVAANEDLNGQIKSMLATENSIFGALDRALSVYTDNVKNQDSSAPLPQIEPVSDGWPLVDMNDDGIRPAGRKDACFYCDQRIGQPHKRNCVTVQKKVAVRWIFDVEVTVPHYWDRDSVLFRFNESSWCANNALSHLEELAQQDGRGCLCESFSAEYLGVVDETPRTKTRKPEPKKATGTVQ